MRCSSPRSASPLHAIRPIEACQPPTPREPETRYEVRASASCFRTAELSDTGGNRLHSWTMSLQGSINHRCTSLEAGISNIDGRLPGNTTILDDSYSSVSK